MKESSKRKGVASRFGGMIKPGACLVERGKGKEDPLSEHLQTEAGERNFVG